ncbi:uncharacterized protein LOC126680833 [Mercurialis annua]|uniref:uncharacterized protein LOC126680833 n=1 Tax=Mercurialis annua TaxID=3986 RepID=UPI00215E4F9C|nr:uncharacterized protein LOC126680833 [Mercurialis annua]
MSDRRVQLDHDKDENPQSSMMQPPFQSAWMSHWTRTNCKQVDDARYDLPLCSDSGENSQRSKYQKARTETEVESGSSKFVKEFRKMHKTIKNEDLTTSLGKSRHETSSKGQHFPMFKSSQNRDGSLSLKHDESSGFQEPLLRSEIGPISGYDVSPGQINKSLPSMCASTPSKIKTQSIECVVSNSDHQVMSNNLPEECKMVISTPVKSEFLGSTSRIVPSEYGSGRIPTESFFPRLDYNQTKSTFLVERKINNSATLSIDDPSTSSNQLRDFLGEQNQRKPNHFAANLYPNNVMPATSSLYHGSFELPRSSPSLGNAETMRICATIGSLEEFAVCPPKFSQTTRQFLITNKADVNLSDRGQMLRAPTISTNTKRNQPSELLSLSSDFGFNVKKRVKLQALDSSTDGETKENIESVHTFALDLKNESSAETDTMDVNTLRVNRLSGAALSVSNKDVNVAQKSPAFEAATVSVREETGIRLPTIELPDINKEVPENPGVASSSDDGPGSTSRTQSLDAEHFLHPAEHPTKSRSSGCSDTSLRLDPYCRWVKRLKTSTSDSFAQGTKIMKMEEASSHGKINKLFGNILNHGKTSSESSEPKMFKSYGKQHVVADHNIDLQRNIESTHTYSVQKSQDKIISHAWIGRWCHNQAASSKWKAESAVVVRKPNSEANEDASQKRQFPSIGAMALMGKAMNGFQACEFRKRGSSIVWNTRGLK